MERGNRVEAMEYLKYSDDENAPSAETKGSFFQEQPIPVVIPDTSLEPYFFAGDVAFATVTEPVPDAVVALWLTAQTDTPIIGRLKATCAAGVLLEQGGRDRAILMQQISKMRTIATATEIAKS
ncbi:hypothetical protein FB480_103431 [Agrobacterium vitis]|nr:hypothetical protein FB480_103431 [Agrobacterium vitis]